LINLEFFPIDLQRSWLRFVAVIRPISESYRGAEPKDSFLHVIFRLLQIAIGMQAINYAPFYVLDLILI